MVGQDQDVVERDQNVALGQEDQDVVGQDQDFALGQNDQEVEDLYIIYMYMSSSNV